LLGIDAHSWIFCRLAMVAQTPSAYPAIV